MDIEEIKAKVKAFIADVEAGYQKIEAAIHAHNQGVLDPAHLEGARDAVAAALTNGRDIVADPQGSPAPDGAPSGEVAQQPSVETLGDETV